MPDARARQPLPRVEDLRANEQGYDREQVRDAFDAFYRHIAQLDSTMRALEAVEVFRDQAGALRKELRALKAAGWTQQPWPSYGRERVSPGLPESLPRFALEAVFLIVVAVVVAVAGFDRLSIVLVMALAWAIVGVVEWAASRDRFERARVPTPVRPTIEPAPAPLRIVPADAAPADAWQAPVPADEADEAEAVENERTIVQPDLESRESPEAAAEAEPVADAEPAPSTLPERVIDAPGNDVPFRPAEIPLPHADSPPGPDAEPAVEPDLEVSSELAPEPEPYAEAETEPEPAPELAPERAPVARWSWAADTTVERARERELAQRPPVQRRRFWQRRRRDSDGLHVESPQPRHVRVLPPGPSFDEQFPVDDVDPWEQELDLSIEEPEGTVDGEPDLGREYAELRPEADPRR